MNRQAEPTGTGRTRRTSLTRTRTRTRKQGEGTSSPRRPSGVSRPSRISWNDTPRGKVAILGWSLFSVEAMRRFDREYVIVGPPGFEAYAKHNRIPFLGGEMTELDQGSARRWRRSSPTRWETPAATPACLLAYPGVEQLHDIHVPSELTSDPAVEGHDIVLPAVREVEQREHFVNDTHFGNIYLFHDDPERIRDLCLKYEDYDFYR